MQRSGITEPKDMRLWIADSSFPEEVDVALDCRCDNIHELNELALVVEKFSIHDRKKLGAAVSMAKPENASQIRRLAENMDLFEFAPGAHTPACLLYTSLADLASPELVTDEAFHLIVCALLLAKYGDAILNFEGK